MRARYRPRRSTSDLHHEDLVLAAIRVGQDVELQVVAVALGDHPRCDDILAKTLAQQLAYRGEGHALGKAAEFVAQPAELLAQLADLAGGFRELESRFLLEDVGVFELAIGLLEPLVEVPPGIQIPGYVVPPPGRGWAPLVLTASE